MGVPHTIPPQAQAIDTDLWNAVAQRPALRRAWHMLDLGIRPESVWEFNSNLEAMTDQERLAAAHAARRLGFLDRTVNAAANTELEHNFKDRYPMPMFGILGQEAINSGLSPHWVYGLIRQESRFMKAARSHVGATGLMQLMPATAKMVGKQLGLSRQQMKDINDPTVNSQLGTHYLSSITQRLDQSPVLGSAAYNAGPGRPASWRSGLTKSISGAAFAETIPFRETRGYVKNVLANALVYGLVYEQKPWTLTELLGTIGAKEATSLGVLCCKKP